MEVIVKIIKGKFRFYNLVSGDNIVYLKISRIFVTKTNTPPIVTKTNTPPFLICSSLIFFSVNFLFTVQFSSDYLTQNHGMVREDSERKY